MVMIMRSGRKVRKNSAFYTNNTHGAWSDISDPASKPRGSRWRIHSGDDIFYKTVQELCDINMNNTILRNDEYKHLPMFKHVNNAHEPEKEGEYTSEQVDDARPYATEAVTYYNHLTHTNYKLVEPGFITRVNLPTCLLFHISFTAKKTDVAAAPEEMFFAELTSASGVLSFSLCVCMGPTDSISGDKLNGCYYCRKYNNVHHPRDGGFVRGGDSLFKKMP